AQLELDFLPPLRPAAAFCALFPPLPLPLLFLLWLEPLLLPPRLEEPSELEIAAARDLLMPFLRSPSYCLSFFTLDPWSLAIVHLLVSCGVCPMRLPAPLWRDASPHARPGTSCGLPLVR